VAGLHSGKRQLTFFGLGALLLCDLVLKDKISRLDILLLVSDNSFEKINPEKKQSLQWFQANLSKAAFI
jgi:hypothetical protein